MNWNTAKPEQVLRRYPRLVAHMICESLGYFTPRCAAQAVLHYKRGVPYWCEWYCHITECRLKPGYSREDVRQSLRQTGHDVVAWSIEGRHRHHGYMVDYGRARQVIQAELEGHGPSFASWF